MTYKLNKDFTYFDNQKYKVVKLLKGQEISETSPIFNLLKNNNVLEKNSIPEPIKKVEEKKEVVEEKEPATEEDKEPVYKGRRNK